MLRRLARFRDRPIRTAVLPAVALAALLALGAGTPVQAQQSTPDSASSPFSSEERRAIDQRVRDYLLENPEIIMEAVEILRQREQAKAEKSRRQALDAHREGLEDPGPLEVFGNPDGDVTIVEFFDYRCPYCRSVTDTLLDVVREDGNTRLVMKEYPILGQASVFAARAAIAASMQGKYRDFHVALMTQVKQIDQASVLKLAERMDLDAAQLQRDMQSDTVDQELQRTFALAEALQIGGTPAFVIGDTLVPGKIGKDRLKQLIAQARKDQEG